MLIEFFAWLGFIIPIATNRVLWEGRSLTLWLINAGHELVVFAVSGGILAIWA